MIKRLAASIREYKLTSILSPLFVSAEVLLEVWIPTLTAELIDSGINAGNMDVVLSVGLKLLIMALCSTFCGAAAGYCASIASTGFAKNLRKDMYEKVQTFSFSNIDKFSTSGLITRITTDVQNIQNSYQMLIRLAVRSPFMMIFSVVMAYRINKTLASMFIVVIPLLGIGAFVVMNIVHPIFKRAFKEYDKLNQIVQENIRGVRVVKVYNKETHEIKKFGKTSLQIFRDFTKAETTLAYAMPYFEFFIHVLWIVIAWFGARFIVAGDMTTGQLTSMISYAMQILMSCMRFAMVFINLLISRANMERVYEVLKTKPDMKEPKNPIHEVADGSIKFENVGFSYYKDPEKLCLKNINVEIKAGETIGIIGGTGSGKSTFISLIPRLYDTLEGTVYVGGKDVRDYSLDSLRNQVSVVLQKNVLFEGTIKSNMLWGNENATDDEITNALNHSCAMEFINSLPDGINAKVEQGGANFSGGQKQRLCIARALLKKPKILILDDSTSAVDTRTDALIRQALKEDLPGTTKLIIAQRIASVKDADKIIMIRSGVIADIGSHDELMERNEIYRDIYDSQTKKGGDFDE